jgi:hypothetical protein
VVRPLVAWVAARGLAEVEKFTSQEFSFESWHTEAHRRRRGHLKNQRFKGEDG